MQEVEQLKLLLSLQTEATKEFSGQLARFNESQQRLIDININQQKALEEITLKFSNGLKSEIVSEVQKSVEEITSKIIIRIDEQAKKELDEKKRFADYVINRLIGGLAILSFIIGTILSILQYMSSSK